MADDYVPYPSVPYLSVAVTGRTLVLRGELDLYSGATVTAAAQTVLVRCRATGQDGVLDACGLTFVDAGGVEVLLDLGRALHALGHRLTAPAASPSLRRISDICGLNGVLGLQHEVADTATPADRTVPTHARS